MADRSLTLGTLFTANATQFFTTVSAMKKKVGELNSTFVSVGTKGAKGIDKASKSVQQLGRSMDQATKKADKHKKSLRGVAAGLDRIKTAAKITASFAAAAAAIGAVTGALSEGLKEMVAYDQGLQNLQAITNATDQEVAGMGETIKDVARTTKFSTGEVAEGMVLLGQAGFSATESMQAMKSVAELATGTLSSMAFTADLMTTTIRAFGMSTVESAKAADIMANAINRSKLTIDKLRIAFNFVGAAAYQAGLTLEETAASMMTLANQGLRASTIGTGLRQVLSRLLAPTGRLREEFEANNIALDKVNPSIVGFRQALQNLLPVIYDQAEGTVDMAKAYQLFGLRGAQAAAVLASAVASGNYDRMLELTYETGSAARMAATQAEGLGLMLKNLADRARLVAVALGEAGLVDALKFLINILRTFVTAIENFIRSDIGRIVVTWAGWTAVILASVKALDLATKAIVFFGKGMGTLVTKIWSVVTAQTALNVAMKTGTGAAITFGGATAIALGPLIAIAAAIAAVVVAIKLWLGANERRIKSLREEQGETTTQVQTLKLYIDILDDLEKKQSKGADITKEHARAIRRMKGDSEALIPVLREEAKFLALNREQLERTYSAKLTQAIAQQVELVKAYNKEVEDATFWNGLWNMIVTHLKDTWQDLKDTLDAIFFTLPRAIRDMVKWVWEWAKGFEGVKRALEFLEERWTTFWEGTKKFYSEWINSYSEGSDEITEKTEQVNKGLVELAKMLDERYRGQKPLEDIIKQLELLTGLKVDPATFEEIKTQIEGITLKLKEEQSQWKAEIDQLPVYFQEMYKNLDGLRKADFAKSIKQMQSELAAFEKTAELMQLSDQERYEARNAIRARHLAKFAEDMEKEKKVTEESVNSQLRVLEILQQGTEEAFHKRTTALMNHYFEQVEMAEGNKEKLMEIEEEFRKNLAAEHEKLNGELKQIDIRRNELTIQLQKQTVEKIKDLHKEIMEDLKDQLKSQYDEILSERDQFLADLAAADKSYEDTIRGIRQKTMTDEQKWLDDRKRANELFNRARRTDDVGLFEEAMQLAASLAREVRDENGEVTKTIEQNARVAENLVTQIHNQHRKLIKDEILDRERQMASLEEAIKKVDQELINFGRTIDELNAKEMVIRADRTIANLQRVYDINHRFKEEWDALKDKTIVLTIKYNYVGKASGGGGDGAEEGGEGGGSEGGEGGGEGGGGGEGESAGGPITTPEFKKGGWIRRWARGGKLGGYGGGDRVKALLEPGEFVIRKEAVKKYGGQVFDSLNKMTAPNVMAGVGKRLGGAITRGFERFQVGGRVPGHAAMRANQQTFNIVVRPKYMTGDRQAMRQMAKDVSKAIEEQSKRWGVK